MYCARRPHELQASVAGAGRIGTVVAGRARGRQGMRRLLLHDDPRGSGGGTHPLRGQGRRGDHPRADPVQRGGGRFRLGAAGPLTSRDPGQPQRALPPARFRHQSDLFPRSGLGVRLRFPSGGLPGRMQHLRPDRRLSRGGRLRGSRRPLRERGHNGRRSRSGGVLAHRQRLPAGRYGPRTVGPLRRRGILLPGPPPGTGPGGGRPPAHRPDLQGRTPRDPHPPDRRGGTTGHERLRLGSGGSPSGARQLPPRPSQ